jgi:intracellular sulfur oxidation DsrE/DsrF family protein
MLISTKRIAFVGLLSALIGLGGCASVDGPSAKSTSPIKTVYHINDGAADAKGNPYNISVEELQAKGIDFRVCNNTLVGRKIDPKKVLPGATIVPSGVAELGKLQSAEGFVYIKP